jgi:hypothetical protein
MILGEHSCGELAIFEEKAKNSLYAFVKPQKKYRKTLQEFVVLFG